MTDSRAEAAGLPAFIAGRKLDRWFGMVGLRYLHLSQANMLSLKGLQERTDRLPVSWEKFTGTLAERQPEALAFATHIPVLPGLARIKKIEHVLELG